MRVGEARVTARAAVVVVLGAASLTPTLSGQAPTTDRGAFGWAEVLASRLNVRGGPSLDGKPIGVVERGEIVCLVTVDDDWAEIFTPGSPEIPGAGVRGWVARGFLSERRGTPAQLAARGCRSPGRESGSAGALGVRMESSVRVRIAGGSPSEESPSSAEQGAG